MGQRKGIGVAAPETYYVVAKRPDSVYQPGRRVHTWIKIKHLLAQEVVIIGWTPGESARAIGLSFFARWSA